MSVFVKQKGTTLDTFQIGKSGVTLDASGVSNKTLIVPDKNGTIATLDDVGVPSMSRNISFSDDFVYTSVAIDSFSDIWDYATFGTGANVSASNGTATLGSHVMSLLGHVVVRTGAENGDRSASVYARMNLGDTTGGSNFSARTAITVECCVSLPMLSSGAGGYTLRACGTLTTSSLVGDPTQGLFFRYKGTVNSGKWQAIARNASTESVINTNVTVSASNSARYHLRIELNSAWSSAEYFINDVSVGTITTNLPSTSTYNYLLIPAAIRKSSGTDDAYAVIDYAALNVKFTNLR